MKDHVERGAAWLDEHRPGWWERIDLDRLDISSGIDCILGQEWEYEYGLDDYPYCLAIEAWGLDDAEVGRADRARLGFTTEFRELDADDLTDAWRSYIERRRTPAMCIGDGPEPHPIGSPGCVLEDI